MDYELFKFKDIAYIKSIILDNPVTDNIVIYKKITILNKLIDSNYDSEIDIISENFNYSSIMNKINHIYYDNYNQKTYGWLSFSFKFISSSPQSN